MAFTPATVVHLLATNFDSTNKNQLTFTSKQSQTDFMLSKIRYTYNNFTYQRKDNFIKIPAHIDTLYNINYVMYNNANFTNKWFYAFVKNMEYVNDNCTLIYIETDYYQTWLFDISIKQSFVKREHTNNDSIGANILPEQLETGEYIQRLINVNMPEQNIPETDLNNNFKMCFVVCSTTFQPVGDESWFTGSTYINGIYHGCAMRVFYDDGTNNVQQEIENYLKTFDNASKGDAVFCIFCCPKCCFLPAQKSNTYISRNPYINSLGVNHTINVPMSNSYDGSYAPKNNKLYTYPYNFYMASNNRGESAEFRREFFLNQSQMSFNLIGNISPKSTLYLTPINYKYGEKEFCLTLGDFPMCTFNSDVFANWLSGNAVGIGLGLAASTATAIGSTATGNVLGVVGSASSIAAQLGELYKHSLQPPQAKGQANSNGAFSAKKTRYDFYNIMISEKYCKIIDEYFSMYGYLTNEVKSPNIFGRRNWNYVETIDANVTGNIPDNDLTAIKNMLNSGITFWHNYNTMYDYGQTNSIV